MLQTTENKLGKTVRLTNTAECYENINSFVIVHRMNSTQPCLACSRLSDSGEDAKVKGTRKVGGAGKRKKEKGKKSFLPFYFRVCAFSLGSWNRLRLVRHVNQTHLFLVRVSSIYHDVAERTALQSGSARNIFLGNFNVWPNVCYSVWLIELKRMAFEAFSTWL